MNYVALKLGSKTLDQKLDFAAMLGGNLTTYIADYPLPPVTPAQFITKVAAINTKKNEVATAQTTLDTKLSDLAALELDLDNSLITDGAYIQDKSGGVAAKITELGVEIQASPNAPTTPDAPQNFRVTAGDNPGEVRTACQSDSDPRQISLIVCLKKFSKLRKRRDVLCGQGSACGSANGKVKRKRRDEPQAEVRRSFGV